MEKRQIHISDAKLKCAIQDAIIEFEKETLVGVESIKIVHDINYRSPSVPFTKRILISIRYAVSELILSDNILWGK